LENTHAKNNSFDKASTVGEIFQLDSNGLQILCVDFEQNVQKVLTKIIMQRQFLA